MGQPVSISEKFHSTNGHFTRTRTEPRSDSVQHTHPEGVFVVQKAFSVLVSSVLQPKTNNPKGNDRSPERQQVIKIF